MLNLIVVPTIVILAMDAFWLGLVAKKFYSTHLRPIMLGQTHLIYAAISYFMFITGLIAYAILPALEKSSKTHPFVAGAFFGFVMYGLYNFTNLSTVKGWSLKVAIVDTLWGTFLGAMGAFIAFIMIKMFFGGI